MPSFPRKLKKLLESSFLHNFKNNVWIEKRAHFFCICYKKIGNKT